MKLSRRFLSPTVDFFPDFDQLFNRAFSHSFLPGSGRRAESFSVFESDDAWHLRTDLPGFRKEDVSLRLEEGVLHLSARREEGHSFHAEAERRFRLPDNINTAEIGARLEDGVLEVTLPKVAPDQPETLNIEVK